jgi:hypothetical protein
VTTHQDPDELTGRLWEERLWEEIVYIGYYLHWSFDSILELDHATRARVINEIGRINALINAGAPVPVPRRAQ